MAGRIRTIKPEVLEDEFAAGLSDAAWRLWVSAWTLADDHGNFRAGERYLAASVWQDTARDAAEPLMELIAKGFVRPYAVTGQRYGHVAGWEKHQRVDNAGKPRIPTPDQDDGTWDHGVSVRFAEIRREPRQLSEGLGGLPLARRARAQSGGETTTSDHDLDPDQRATSPARAHAKGDEHVPFALDVQPPPTPKKPRRSRVAGSRTPASGESPTQAFWRLFRAAYRVEYETHYPATRNDGAVADHVAGEAQAIAQEQAKETGDDYAALLEELMAWWAKAYLQLTTPFLIEKKHPLYGLHSDLNQLGNPPRWAVRPVTESGKIQVVPISRALTEEQRAEIAARLSASPSDLPDLPDEAGGQS